MYPKKSATFEITEEGRKMYINRLKALAEECIEKEYGGKELTPANWRGVLRYIGDHNEPSHISLEYLDFMFDCYLRLCEKYSFTPSEVGFSIMVGMNKINKNPQTISITANELARAAKRWHATCGAVLADNVQQTPRTNVNGFFTLKAVYGYTEEVKGVKEADTAAPITSRSRRDMALEIADVAELEGPSEEYDEDIIDEVSGE